MPHSWAFHFERACGRFVRFARGNPMYLFCSLLYYLLAVWFFAPTWRGYLFFAIIYILSLGVAFSFWGERLMRFLNHIRPLETAKEKEYLRPLFQEVYKKTLIHSRRPWKIDLYIIDSIAINAYAIGSHTIAITKGAMHAFSEEQLKAVLAHEIGHIVYADTYATIYAMIGNGIFSVFIILFKLITRFLGLIFYGDKRRTFTEALTEGIVFVLSFLMTVCMAMSDRSSEFRADQYAVKLGYGDNMVEALYLLEKLSLSGERTIVEKLLASHPRVTMRIESLEITLGIQKAERK